MVRYNEDGAVMHSTIYHDCHVHVRDDEVTLASLGNPHAETVFK